MNDAQATLDLIPIKLLFLRRAGRPGLFLKQKSEVAKDIVREISGL